MLKNWRAWVLADALILLALAAWLVWPLFQTEYFNRWESIESIFIADARFLAENWPFPSWQPDWYCGDRFDYIYPPALLYGTAGLSRLFEISTARAYHIYVGLLYALGTAGFYLFARLASGSRLWAILTALITTLTSPFFLFQEQFRRDYSHGGYPPVRLGALVLYGEGPHMCAFALIPFAMILAWYGFKDGRAWVLAACGAVIALVVANNLYGAVAVLIFFIPLMWSIWLANQDRRILWRALLAAAIAYGMIATWFTPSFLRLTLRNMRLVSQPGNSWSLWLTLAVAALFAAITWRWARGKPALAWPVFLAGNATVWTLQVLGNEYLGFRVIGEPQRQVPEFDWAFVLAACGILAWMANRNRAGKVTAAVVVALALYVPVKYIKYPWKYFEQDTQPQRRIEYRLTKWLSENMPQSRTFATGSMRFWYNAWFDGAQMSGGSDQGLMNLAAVEGYYAITGSQEISGVLAWAQALGVDALIVSEDPSQEKYRDFSNAKLLKRHLKVLYESGEGDYVLAIPRRYPPRVRVVDAGRLRALPRSPAGPATGTAAAYAKLLEEGPPVPVQFGRPAKAHMEITATLGSGHAIAVQETYDPGWKAYAGGKPVPVSPDAMEFLLIDPGAGNHKIDLVFEPPLETRAGRWIQLFTLAAIAVLCVRGSAF